ncbi:ribosomal protein S18-alanine N-acetyltransferase [Amphiplicatus metriothermophilus]|uniref:[Ribosomal protein bS18]-alanine N-acetyltransferase n=1 Tax=Amphiplicatus metriothermophilus TaxID=1519374 RepID=A0A239PKM4_9PROT|nr:ribosomal protein S18-alanine N-acetyltransferase [Amphiplicatus metriothermophilus]MBB5517555.1 ribosomal-protein-alanine N-acetyltransferase [Amphiplicatus metriothermophilus]SNT68110.1 [SSU ribosomal protein S18P]-alanine acetyltransferase [Amphiplicatus metriothermophilus]
MSGWLVRPAAPADMDALVAIEADSFGPASWGADAVRQGLGEPGVFALVAEGSDGAIGGFILWRRAADEGEILSLAAAARVRRAGAAKALLAEVILAAEAMRLRALFLEVRADNAAARALYEKARFATVGRRRRYYRDGADALVLRRAI